MKIAIIGPGIAGLAAARLLNDRAEIVVYERDGRIGGHSNTVVAEDAVGQLGISGGSHAGKRRRLRRAAAPATGKPVRTPAEIPLGSPRAHRKSALAPRRGLCFCPRTFAAAVPAAVCPPL